VALRPLGVGDFFDGAFQTIRRNPTAMVGLAAAVTTLFMVIPTVLTLLTAASGNLSLDLFARSSDPAEQLAAGIDAGATSLVANLGGVFGAAATVITTGILVRVVAEAVLGRRTGIGAAWRATRGRLLRLVGLTLLNALVVLVLLGPPVALAVLTGYRLGIGAAFAVGVPLVLAALALLVVVQIRFFHLAAPALMLEGTGIVASMRRARSLSQGQFWRLFGVYLLTVLVATFVGYVVGLPLGVVGLVGAWLLPGTGGALSLVFSSYLSQIIVGAITTPFTAAVVSLQYVDQRIRKEGLDVQLIAAAQQPADLR
jgi:hypothetical protein